MNKIKNEKIGRGYVGFSKSVNAVEAEKSGLFPASKIAKITKTSVNFIKSQFEPCEWHHTSKHYNRTYYYSLEEVEEFLKENPDAFKESKKNSKKEEGFTRMASVVRFYDWSEGYPITVEIADVMVSFNGKSSYTFEYNGKKITKRENTKGFYISWKPTEEEITKYEAMKRRIREANEREAALQLQKEIKEYEEGIANGTYLDVPEFLVEKVIKGLSRKFWIAVKDGQIIDAICMYYDGFQTFESYREQSRSLLAEKGQVVSVSYYFITSIKKHIFIK